MTRALHGWAWFFVRREKRETMTVKNHILVGFFIIFSLASAFSVIYLKDLSRRLFIQYQTLQQAQLQSEMERSKLLLEEGAWSTQSRIQDLANTRLNMQIPVTKEIVMIETPKTMLASRE